MSGGWIPLLTIIGGCVLSGLTGVAVGTCAARHRSEQLAATLAVECSKAWERGFHAGTQVTALRAAQLDTSPADLDPWTGHLEAACTVTPPDGYDPELN